MTQKKKIIRATTIPLSLKVFLDGAMEGLMAKYDVTLVASPGEHQQIWESTFLTCQGRVFCVF